LLALLVDLESLAQLVSIGTLAVFFCVCLGCLRRRYYEPGKNSMAPFVWRCAMMTLFNIGAHELVMCQPEAQHCTAGRATKPASAEHQKVRRVYDQLPGRSSCSGVDRVGRSLARERHDAPVAASPVASSEVCGAAEPVHPSCWHVSELASHRCASYLSARHKREHKPTAPLVAELMSSWSPTGSLDWQAYVRFGGWLVISILVYVCYGMHMAEAHDAKLAAT